MVWACFDFFGSSRIVFLEGSIDSYKYVTILEEHLIPFLRLRNSESGIFQQDNARPHIARSTMSWINDHGIKCLSWPPYSPDLNPIENLWGILVQRIYANGRQYANLADLKESIITEWNEIEEDIFKNLSISMKDRIYDLLIKNGSNSKY